MLQIANRKVTLKTNTLLVAFTFLWPVTVDAQQTPVGPFPKVSQVLALGSECPISIESTEIPKGFRGHQIEDVFSHLQKHQSKFKKSEFETQAQYEERLKASSKLISPMRIGQSVCFILTPAKHPTMELAFDAEKGMLRASWNEWYWQSELDIEYPYYLTLSGQVSDNGSYIAENAFSAKLRIQRQTLSAYGLRSESRFPGSSAPAAQLLPTVFRVEVTSEIPSSDARQIKRNIALLVVGAIDSPIAGVDSQVNSPTRDNPYERRVRMRFVSATINALMLFDSITGRILGSERH